MYMIFKAPRNVKKKEKELNKRNFLIYLIHDHRHCLHMAERLQLGRCSENERSEFFAVWEYILISELLYKECGHLIYESGRMFQIRLE